MINRYNAVARLPDGTPARAGIVTYAKRKARLRWYNDWALLLQYLFARTGKKVDVHSGYFAGVFSKRLIYRLACLGFEEMLHGAHTDPLQARLAAAGAPRHALTPQERAAALDKLSAALREKQIKVLLSPERYRHATS